MKINIKMEQKFDDPTRFEKIVDLLPEEKMRIFLDELWNGYYSEGFLEILVNYKDYSENILAEFKNKELEKKRKVFNESFRSLLEFLNTHFFFYQRKYVLYPELRETSMWDQRLKELHSVVNIFKEKYNEFMVAGKEFLDKISSVPEKISEAENKFPYKLPSGTKWEYITIKFLNDKEVSIKVYKFKHTTNYKKIGFEDKRNDRPDQQWELLKIFAKYGGEITWKTPIADEKIKKTKELLTKILQNYFKIEYDPFYPYHSSYSGKAKKSYKIKITLVPPSIPKTKQDSSTKKKSLDREIEEFYKEQTPAMYDR
jgi:hypothetical protein